MGKRDYMGKTLSSGIAWTALLQKLETKKKLLRSKEMRRKASQNRVKHAVVELTGGAAAPAPKLEDLKEREASGHRSSTNSYVMLVMLLICVLLLAGMYVLVKSLGNPAESEYPANLQHRKICEDLEAQ